MTTRLVRTVVALSLLLIPPGASGQDFGPNKVAYEDFEFQILATEHFDIYYYAQEERAARIAARLAERWYARFSSLLHHTFEGRQPLVLYGSQAEFAQTKMVHGLLPDSVGGVTEGSRRRIVMPFAPTLAETDRVIGHELVHAFQFDIARRHGGDTGQPLWFIEGMAEYLSHGALEPDSSLWLRDAVLSGRLPEGMGAAASDLSAYRVWPCVLVVPRRPLRRRHRREIVETGPQAAAARRIASAMRRARTWTCSIGTGGRP